MADALSSLVVWNKGPEIPLKKLKDFSVTTPCIVRLAESENSKQLPPKLREEALLLHSVVLHRKVICQCVDMVTKDGQMYFSQQKFSIPLQYHGWFEVLSEDGKAIPPCKLIEQIAERNPETFLIRSKVKCYLSEETGEPTYEKTRSVQKGEVMSVIEKVTVTLGWRRQKKQLLHCLDSNGLDVYFDFQTSGQFSVMAGPTNISGVHNIEGIISRFRLPLTVRVVSGQIPRIASENERPGLLRLLELQKDTTALLLPTRSNDKLVPVSVRTNMALILAANMNEIRKSDIYTQLLRFCDTKAEKYFKTMQVLISTRQNTTSYNASTLPARRVTQSSPESMKASTQSLLTEEDVLFAEVDDLYAYVRRGGVPPRPRPRSWATTVLLDPESSISISEQKSSSQPLLCSNGKPRGLLATLTAGRFPTKSGAVVRQRMVSSSPQETTFVIQAPRPTTLPSGKDGILKAFIEKYAGSSESLQTEVDPYVDERHYQNFETIEHNKRMGTLSKQRSTDDNFKSKRTNLRYRSQSVQLLPTGSLTAMEGLYFTLEESKAEDSATETITSSHTTQCNGCTALKPQSHTVFDNETDVFRMFSQNPTSDLHIKSTSIPLEHISNDASMKSSQVWRLHASSEYQHSLSAS